MFFVFFTFLLEKKIFTILAKDYKAHFIQDHHDKCSYYYSKSERLDSTQYNKEKWPTCRVGSHQVENY